MRTAEGPVKVVHAGGMFDEHFLKAPTDRQLKTWRNIFFRVACIKNIPPRHPMFDYEREMGSAFIEKILLHQPFSSNVYKAKGKGLVLTMYFPERHMSVQEQVLFTASIASHPEIKKVQLAIIEMATSSPMVISGLIKDDIRIISLDECDKNIAAMQKLIDGGENKG
jgi:hypothetical protein